MISIQLMVAFTALAAVVTIGMVVLMISDSREQRRRREIIEAKLAVLKFDDGDDEATLKEAVKHAPEPKYVRDPIGSPPSKHVEHEPDASSVRLALCSFP